MGSYMPISMAGHRIRSTRCRYLSGFCAHAACRARRYQKAVLTNGPEVYRNLLADRKILVVLDDVAGESQVYPLLPRPAGPPEC